ncbi:MAG TPA: hypothetical protein VJ891_09605 [Casimicrobiaceae bacterium]|nr:hypothetical protein [Casimicrobiaceae bacterium]
MTIRHRSAQAEYRFARTLSLAIGVAIIVAGCASAPLGPSAPPASAAPIPRNAEPPPPSVNLSGFPLPYRQGYYDGCASVSGTERKDAARFASDPNYRTGWQDGLALCKRK